jgi:hypothetical protein
VSQDMQPKRSISLYSEYDEKGFQGATEIDTDYSLEVNGSSRNADVILTIQQTKTRHPSQERISQETKSYTLAASELVVLLQKHGKPAP